MAMKYIEEIVNSNLSTCRVVNRNLQEAINR